MNSHLYINPKIFWKLLFFFFSFSALEFFVFIQIVITITITTITFVNIIIISWSTYLKGWPIKTSPQTWKYFNPGIQAALWHILSEHVFKGVQ